MDAALAAAGKGSWKMLAVDAVLMAAPGAGRLASKAVPARGVASSPTGAGSAARRLGGADDLAGARRPVDGITEAGRATGGRNPNEWDEMLSHIKDPDTFRAWEVRDRYAQDYYDVVRAAGDDHLESIARSSGMKAEEIRQVRDHVFLDEHRLRDRVGRFDPDPDMADAWRRLENGNPQPEDLDLLRHELHESTYLRQHGGATYDEAHRATIDAGFPWNPPRWRPGS